MSRQTTQQKRLRIKRKIRSTISGTENRPRLSVFRSNNFLYAQLINDDAHNTLISVNDLNKKNGTKVQSAIILGAELAKLAKTKGIDSVVFDRNGFKYSGRIKAFADSAREGGLNF